MLLKTALFILANYEDELLSMKIEDLNQFLIKVAKSDFFNNPKIVCEYKNYLKKFKLTSELMNQFKEEEEMIRMMAEARNFSLPYTKVGSKHYIQTDKEITEVHFQI